MIACTRKDPVKQGINSPSYDKDIKKQTTVDIFLRWFVFKGKGCDFL
jgi:hypothetical protein